MKISIVPLGLIALLAVSPEISAGQRGIYEKVPYNNNPEEFCRVGYPLHNWKSLVPKQGIILAPIIPKLPVNRQYIELFREVCMAGGRPMPINPSSGNSKPKDPAATF